MRACAKVCVLLGSSVICALLPQVLSSACDQAPWIYLAPIVHREADSDAVSGEVTVEAKVREGVDVVSVDLILDCKVVAVVSQAPYRMIWDTAKETEGVHYWQARGHRADGSMFGSDLVKVTVKHAAATPPKPPTPVPTPPAN